MYFCKQEWAFLILSVISAAASKNIDVSQSFSSQQYRLDSKPFTAPNP